jgi:hypothetical protein
MPFEFDHRGDFEERNSSVEIVAAHPLISGLEADFRIPLWTARHRISSRASATSLVRYTDGSPFLAIRDVDKGRVLAINSDELWKLQMQPSSRAPAFAKLGRRILQYLTFDPDLNPRGILSGPWRVGQEVSLEMATNERTKWHIRSLAFHQFNASFNNESKIKFKVPFPGVFEVRADGVSDVRTFQTEEQPWMDEWKNLVSDPAKLKLIAKESGGKFFDSENFDEIFKQPLSGRQMVSAKVSSWSRESKILSWLVLLGCILLMCGDFFLRKRDHWDA